MRFIKRTAAIFLALLMCISVLPSAFAADDDVIASGEAGEGITWTLTEGGILTVSGNGPIQDKIEVEIGEDGLSETQKLDCLGWQLDAVIENLAETMSVEEAISLRYNIVKELVIEEGITGIPEGEFENIYPRKITLPSTLVTVGYSAVNAEFAESLTVNSKTLDLADGISIFAYGQDAEPFASLDEAIQARIESDCGQERISLKMNPVYDLGAIFELSNGIDNGFDPDEFLDGLNETYGAQKSSIDEYIPMLLSIANENFGTSYQSVDELFSVVTDEDDGTYVARDPEFDSILTEMFEAYDLGDRLITTPLGMENYDSTAYQWITVKAPSGSKAEEAAKLSRVPFSATDEGEKDDSFLGKIKAFFGKVVAFFGKVIDYVKMIINIIKPM